MGLRERGGGLLRVGLNPKGLYERQGIRRQGRRPSQQGGERAAEREATDAAGPHPCRSLLFL